MKRSSNHTIRYFFLFVIILFTISAAINFFPSYASKGDNWAKLHFDVKLLRLNTNINVYKDDAKIGSIKGNVVRLITDPLTLYDNNDNNVAHADDTYHLIAQDSHTIIVNGVVTAEMVGRFRLIGNKYDIYNQFGTKIATAYFDYFNLVGKMVDTNGEVIAVYRANPFLKDFNVYVSPDNPLDETTLSLIYSSYYSDQKYDSNSSSSSNSSNNK